MGSHSHDFVETYTGLVGFGFNRETDEKTVMYYLQKFSDDALLARIVPRMTETELAGLFDTLAFLLKTHLTEEEYHALFLKDQKE